MCRVTEDLPGVIDYADLRVYINDGTVKESCPDLVDTDGKNYWIPDTFLSGVIEVEEPFRSVFSTVVFTFMIFTTTVLLLFCCCGVCQCCAERKTRNTGMKTDGNCSETDIDETVIDMEVIPL